MSGNGSPSASSRWKRRPTTSWMLRKSSTPATPRILKRPQPGDVAAVIFLRNPQVARRRTLVDAGQQAGAEPAPFFVTLRDVEAARAKLEDLLQNLDRPPQAAGAGEGSIELGAPLLRLAG